jgi:uncharacterized protein YndB with AHSA1/START domain
MSKNNLVVDRPTRSYSMSRIFDAPRDLVWKILTDPARIPEWWGPRYLTTTVDKMDVKVGGEWRFIQKDAEGKEYAFNGVYTEVRPPERYAYTFEFEPMAGHISTETCILEELPGGKTKITARTVFNTLEDLEGMLQSGMEEGATDTWDRLEEILVKEKVVVRT